MRFNTGIAAMMEFVNGATKWPSPRPRAALRPLLLLLSPYAPHLAEELWEHSASCGSSTGSSSVAGNGVGAGSIAYEPWPVADEALLVEDTIMLPVQV